VSAGAKVAALVMEEGISHLYLIGKATSILKAKIDKKIPKKKNIQNQYAKAKGKFFD
jgi:protein pelota